jgi:hypothetical protein
MTRRYTVLLPLFTRIVPLLLFLFSWNLPAIQAQAPCECTNCPQFMPDLFTGGFFISVMNATNNTLGQNGQGVCGVRVHFDHTAICDIAITLTAPSGQAITLVGPIGQFCTSNGNAGTDWDVLFLPCNDPSVAPDPGFTAQWNNNQNWGGNNSYTGSYYPFAGCMNNFTGSVNGTWTLTVTDGQANDVGNLFDYEIIFCDPSGINCFSCAANAGNLPQPDVTACKGSPDLNLNLPPAYTPPNMAPPASEYSYTYVVSGAGGVIRGYEDGPDLTAYPAGNYTVCGMSYYTDDEPNIPAPNGVLTLTQLTTQLVSSQPPFCGRITGNCINVTIQPPPPDIVLNKQICAPNCYDFYGTDYCQSGTYTETLQQGECFYTATLNLTVLQPQPTFVTEVICPGTCSLNPTFPTACTAGTYQELLTSTKGCDSLVILNLNVVNVNAAIALPTPTLSCSQMQVTVLGTGSTVVGNTTYLWTTDNGGSIVGANNMINAMVDAPGNYYLRVCRQQGTAFCCDSTSAVVISSQNPPAPPVINGPSSLCTGANATFTIPPVNGVTSYNWTVPAGVTIVSGQGNDTLQVTWNTNNNGSVCAAAVNACGPGTSTCFPVTTLHPPLAAVITGDTTICLGDTVMYSVPTPPAGTTYNWTVTGGTILSGNGTTAIKVLWNSILPGSKVCITGTNTCGPGTPTCKNITVLSPPAVVQITGGTTVCAGDTVQYTITNTAPGTSYNWSAIGGTILSGNGTSSVKVLWNNASPIGTICASAANTCGQSQQTCTAISINTPPAQPVMTGDSTLCVGANGAYVLTAPNGSTGFSWTAPAGATITAGQNTTNATINWSAAPGGPVCVAASNGCGTGPQQCLPVTVYAVPVANAGVDGAICGTMFNLSATTSISGSAGVWSAGAGTGTAVFVTPNQTQTGVSVSANGIYSFLWTETNGICSDVDTVSVNFNASPVAGLIQSACDGTNLFYTVVFPITGGSGPYNIPGGTVNLNTFTSNQVNSGQPYSFTITDANGCLSTVISGIVNCNCATNAGQMSGATLSACPGGSVTAQASTGSNFDTDDIGAFVLHTASGPSLGTVLDENTTGTFSKLPGMTYGTTYYISYIVGNNVNGLPDLTDQCFSVASGQPVIFYDYPMAQAGADDAVCGLSLGVQGAGPGVGVWSVLSNPAGGTATLSTPQNPSTNVSASLTGIYSLAYTLTDHGCTAADTLSLAFNPSPATGVVLRTCDATNQNYSVSFPINGGTAPYTVNGQSLAGANYVSAPLANSATYQFTVTDVNGCEASVISGSYSCNCATDAGQVSLTPITICGSDTAVVQYVGGQNLDANDTIVYVLHTASGTTLGTIIDQNKTGKFAFQTGMNYGVSYYISRTAGNNVNGVPDPLDPCFSIAQGQPVVFLQQPSPDAGTPIVVCGNNAALSAVAGAFPGAWTQVSGTGTATFGNDQSPTSPVSVDQAGAYTFRWTETNGVCVSDTTTTVNFYPLPAVTNLQQICNGSNTGYTLQFTVTSGTAPFSSAGLPGTFSGSNFTSNLLANNANYQFAVMDAFGCISPVVSGSYSCNCLTDAGTMQTAPVQFCADQPASVTWNNDAMLDADDGIKFYLHSLPGTTLGTVYGVGNVPVFNFGPGLQTGVTYYISAVAGTLSGANIDLNDPCLSVSPGVPVRWKPIPTATLTGDATICNGGSAVLSFNATGEFPLKITYSDGSGTNIVIPVTGPQLISSIVMPTTTTIYNLVSVADNSLPTCAANLSESVQVVVNQPVNGGIANDPLELCAGVDLPIQLTNLITGADFGGVWTETSAVPASPGAFLPVPGTFITGGQVAGVYTFKYKLTAAAPCPSAETSVTVELHAQPVADAGEDQTLNCNQAAVTLGGPGTTQGAGTQYQWTQNGATIGTTAQLFTGTPGMYNLLVTNEFSCADSDLVEITTDLELPIANSIKVQNVRCWGEQNGSITLDSITSTHAPVLFSLNGASFSTLSSFKPLGPGKYSITLQDANGCTWTTDTLEITQPQQLTVDLGPDINVVLGDLVTLDALTATPFSALQSIRWQPLLDTANAETLTQQFQPFNSVQVEIKLVDYNGCTASSKVFVHVDKKHHVFIPNIIKPGSNLNDRLTVFGGKDVESVDIMRIYDRWGNQMFEAREFLPNDQSKGWDGKYKGETVSPGVYIYYAQVRFITGETMIYKGDVTVFN